MANDMVVRPRLIEKQIAVLRTELKGWAKEIEEDGVIYKDKKSEYVSEFFYKTMFASFFNSKYSDVVMNPKKLNKIILYYNKDGGKKEGNGKVEYKWIRDVRTQVTRMNTFIKAFGTVEEKDLWCRVNNTFLPRVVPEFFKKDYVKDTGKTITSTGWGTNFTKR